MNFLNAMKTGALWGCCPGAILGLCAISSTASFLDGLVLLAVLILLSSLCGGILGLFVVIANKTLEFIIYTQCTYSMEVAKIADQTDPLNHIISYDYDIIDNRKDKINPIANSKGVNQLPNWTYNV